nr:surface carbohydrate biosynthesis protein [Methylopila capsulata]
MRQVIIPVIVSTRELDAKLLMALHAARAGIDSIIGSHTMINLDLHLFKPGVYICPSFTAGSAKISAIARQLGHATAAFDEAGLVWHDAESYCHRRISLKTLANLDVVFAWGKEQGDILRSAGRDLPVRVVETGHPRIDLLRPEICAAKANDAAALKQELGDFILVTSSFGWINDRRYKRSWPLSSDDLQKISDESQFTPEYVENSWKTFQAFQRLLPELARRFPDRKIVLRPHPAEDVEVWRAAAAGLANVVIRNDLEIVTWLSAARHMIHSGSTTAIEAAFIGLDPIYYRPYPQAGLEFRQSSAASVIASSEDELVGLLSDPAGGAARSQDLLRKLDHMVAQRAGPLASEEIATVLSELFDRGDLPRGSPAGRLAGKISSMVRRYRKLKKTDGEAPPADKFPAMAAADVQRRLDAYGERLGIRPPKVAARSERVFRLTAR